MLKICSKCGVEKELGEFVKHKDCKDGVAGYCKECEAIKTKQYRAINREILLAKKTEYKRNNAEKVKESAKKFRVNNPEKVNAWKKNAYENNKAHYLHKMKELYILKKEDLSLKAKNRYRAKHPLKIVDRETIKKQSEENKLKYKETNQKKLKAWKDKWYRGNAPIFSEQLKKEVFELSDRYLKKQLGKQKIIKEAMTPEIIETYRLILKIKRKLNGK